MPKELLNMIVVKDNIERIIRNDQLDIFEKLGYKEVGKKKNGKSHLKGSTVTDILNMGLPELKKLAEEKGLEDLDSLNIEELRAALKAYGSIK